MREEEYVISVLSMILERIRSIHYEGLLVSASIPVEVYLGRQTGVKVRELENEMRQSATADR